MSNRRPPGRRPESGPDPPSRMLTTYVVRDGVVRPGPLDARGLAEIWADPTAALWADFEHPTEEEYGLLSSVFHFHPLAIEDCRVQNEWPKLDEYGDSLFVVLHCPTHEAFSSSLDIIEHHFFLTGRALVTVHDAPSPMIDEVRKEAGRDSPFLKRGMDGLLHGMADRIADRYVRLLDEFDVVTDDLERRVMGGPDARLLESIFSVKRSLLHLVRLAHLQRDVVHRLSRESFVQIAEPTRVYFQDVYDHLFRVSTMAEFYRDTVAGVRDAYLSVVSNRLNETMKVFTRIATLLFPLTVITGIYGMNFDHMPELHWRYGYFAVLGGMVLLVAGLFIWFKRRGWW